MFVDFVLILRKDFLGTISIFLKILKLNDICFPIFPVSEAPIIHSLFPIHKTFIILRRIFVSGLARKVLKFLVIQFPVIRNFSLPEGQHK
jgi:hypothetical protein